MPFDSIESALEAIGNKEMVIVVDDEDRENEGDLIMSARFCLPDDVNFMIGHGRGMLCTPMAPDVTRRRRPRCKYQSVRRDGVGG